MLVNTATSVGTMVSRIGAGVGLVPPVGAVSVVVSVDCSAAALSPGTKPDRTAACSDVGGPSGVVLGVEDGDPPVVVGVDGVVVDAVVVVVVACPPPVVAVALVAPALLPSPVRNCRFTSET